VLWLPSLAILAALIAVLPVWPHSRGWGYAPAGMVGVILGVVVLFTVAVGPG
jgi:hypothetical protein